MKKPVSYLTLLATILVCACTVPGIPEVGPSLGGLGLEITSFSAEPSPVFSGGTVRLVMETGNLGGTTVNVNQSLVYLTGSNFDAWGGETYHNFSKDMKAEDIVRGIPADTQRFSWPLTAPSLSAGQTRTDTFIGRIYHEYSTNALGNVWVYSESEADAARTAGRALYPSSFTYTKGPVGISVKVMPDPIILYGSEKSFTLYITLNNLASGTIYTSGAVSYYIAPNVALDSDELNKVYVDVIPPTGVSIGPGCESWQDLIEGRETVLVCDVTLPSAPTTFESYALDVVVKYGYYTERTTTVTIQGR